MPKDFQNPNGETFAIKDPLMSECGRFAVESDFWKTNNRVSRVDTAFRHALIDLGLTKGIKYVMPEHLDERRSKVVITFSNGRTLEFKGFTHRVAMRMEGVSAAMAVMAMSDK